jgi:Transposase
MTVSVGEPKRNKDYHRAHSPKRKSDSTESHAMARYAAVERLASSHGKPAAFAALRRVASRLEGQTKQSTRLINQLHETLSASFPELATIINDRSDRYRYRTLRIRQATDRLLRNLPRRVAERC